MARQGLATEYIYEKLAEAGKITLDNPASGACVIIQFANNRTEALNDCGIRPLCTGFRAPS